MGLWGAGPMVLYLLTRWILAVTLGTLGDPELHKGGSGGGRGGASGDPSNMIFETSNGLVKNMLDFQATVLACCFAPCKDLEDQTYRGLACTQSRKLYDVL